jgi:hypothetical protein
MNMFNKFNLHSKKFWSIAKIERDYPVIISHFAVKVVCMFFFPQTGNNFQDIFIHIY